MTELTDFQKKISQLLTNVELRFWEPMAKHTSFRIGGPCDLMVCPKSVEELQESLRVLRRFGERPLILGGGSHRSGKQGGNWHELEQFARQYYPDAEIAARWATQDCMTLDHVPYIGQYAKNTPDLFVATGFNKWGMTTSMAAANLLTDLILGKKSPYEEVFSPSRG